MKNKLFAQVLQAMTKYFIVLVLIVMVGIAASGIRVVDSGNVALILRFGKLVGDTPEEQIHEPGLLFAFPYIIDEVVMVPTGSIMEQSVTTYYTPDEIDLKRGTRVLSVETLVKLCEVLGITPDALLGFGGEEAVAQAYLHINLALHLHTRYRGRE